jgi:predicted DNA-binding transcriptional regulator AlpA
MSGIHPVQPDLCDRESAQDGVQPSAGAGTVRAGKGAVKTPVKAPSFAAAEAEQPCVTTAPVSMQEPEQPFLPDVAVAARYAVSRPTIWRWTKAQCGVPQPIKVSKVKCYTRFILGKSGLSLAHRSSRMTAECTTGMPMPGVMTPRRWMPI